ncbi:hypothetical protein DICSQDRAFT_64233 [Dichomitus squalens LYAD-421 SS1]|uniref:HNH nuclease domain-containing protein n=2 Tax=Dichomitus squalens TaxID=114155 RepID=A0A4Q9PF86_9APHY|nr:uncharacterized protein DICSQDRAFT_64233 [Dichomitus squalens LYAD-421 SS1]EJF59951.1 hypothetical protein DICSQDRAFT_64233 [Dichomitus squalens LYAD-421 SS1]TBU53634.1 hypothetical protein BD310DRAFT_829774 [Dichomitus squalens]
MPPLSAFPLPLQPFDAPLGFGWLEREFSTLSTSTAFDTGLNERDIFSGKNRCVVCGYGLYLEHCHIIPQSKPELWAELKARRWLPEQAKHRVQHEPRNGILMCPNHHKMFDSLDAFIRFDPQTRKFIFINHSNRHEAQEHHGKAIALDIQHRHVPFPSAFIIHEVRVRAAWPFQPDPHVPDEINWQDWITSDGVVDATGKFRHDPEPDKHDVPLPSPSSPVETQVPSLEAAGTGTSGWRRLAPVDDDLIAKILAFQHTMPSWKACVIEGTSWDGTAEENMQKYVSIVGLGDSVSETTDAQAHDAGSL